MFYVDKGRGDPPFLLVHGYTADCTDWVHQIPDLADSSRVIAADTRGHGRSSAPDSGYDVSTLARDMAGLIDHLGCGPVIAVGHSLGGLIVSALAVEHPDHVRAVVAVDPGYLLNDEVNRGFEELSAAMARDDPVTVAQGMLAQIYGPASPPHIKIWHEIVTSGVPEHVVRGALGHQFQSASGPESDVEYLRRRGCPVLAFYAAPGIDDGWVPMTVSERVAAERAVTTHPSSRIVVWEGTGHWLQKERPAEFNALVRSWVAGLD
jgi:pimeloyl-ACP methyl ester carboxylesterase